MSTRTFITWFLLAVLALALAACGDDDPKQERAPRTIFIPTEMGLVEAAESAIPGDTLEISATLTPLAEGVVFNRNQTPLTIRGTKTYPMITVTQSTSVFRFESPLEGTRVENLMFAGQAAGVLVVGPGDLEIDDCIFTGGAVQLHVTGITVETRVSNSLFRDATDAAIDVATNSSVQVDSCTIVNPIRTGIRLAPLSTARISHCIVSGSGLNGITCSGSTDFAPGSGCNCLWDNGASGNDHYVGCTAPPGDFVADPLFCDAEHGDYRIQDISPCRADNSGEDCDRVGARDVGCSAAP